MVGGGLVAGAILGRILVSLISWLAVLLLGFVATGAAALTVLAGQQLVNAITRLNTNVSSPRDLEFSIDQLIALPIFQNQQVIIVSLLAGLVGGLLASRYYSLLITAADSVVGAALLSVALPLRKQAISGGVAVSESAPSNLSSGLLVLFLVAGLLVQGYRYGEELALPFVGSDYDPLPGE